MISINKFTNHLENNSPCRLYFKSGKLRCGDFTRIHTLLHINQIKKIERFSKAEDYLRYRKIYIPYIRVSTFKIINNNIMGTMSGYDFSKFSQDVNLFYNNKIITIELHSINTPAQYIWGDNTHYQRIYAISGKICGNIAILIYPSSVNNAKQYKIGEEEVTKKIFYDNIRKQRIRYIIKNN